MADFTLTRPDIFPEGLKVGAYLSTNWPTPWQPSGEPLGEADDEQEVEEGSLTFTGLTDEAEYWAVAEVSEDTFYYLKFIAGADTAQAADIIHLSQLDTDGTLAANSDTNVPSQKAVKTYADALLGSLDALVYKGVKDCSGNPKFPKADAGHTYMVSVAGKIGGASGYTVAVGDILLCNTDGAAEGTKAEVGAKWDILDAQATVEAAVKVEKERAETAEALKASKTELTTEKERAEAAEALKAAKTELTAITANEQTGDYTLALTDAGKVVEMNAATAKAITVPANATIAFPVGSEVVLSRIGAGALEIKAAEGVTIKSAGELRKLNSQYSGAVLRKRATNEWVLTGDLG